MNAISNDTDLLTAFGLIRQEQITAQTITAEHNAAVAAVHAKFEGKAEAHAAEAVRLTELVRDYVKANKARLIPKGKSSRFAGHVFGWRSSGAVLELPKKLKTPTLIAQIKTWGQKAAELLIVTKETFSKDGAKAHWNTEIALDPATVAIEARTIGDLLRTTGIKLATYDEFFLEPAAVEGAPKTPAAK